MKQQSNGEAFNKLYSVLQTTDDQELKEAIEQAFVWGAISAVAQSIVGFGNPELIASTVPILAKLYQCAKERYHNESTN